MERIVLIGPVAANIKLSIICFQDEYSRSISIKVKKQAASRLPCWHHGSFEAAFLLCKLCASEQSKIRRSSGSSYLMRSINGEFETVARLQISRNNVLSKFTKVIRFNFEGNVCRQTYAIDQTLV